MTDTIPAPADVSAAEVLKDLEWARPVSRNIKSCPCCYAWQSFGHDPGCRLAAAINVPASSEAEGLRAERDALRAENERLRVGHTESERQLADLHDSTALLLDEKWAAEARVRVLEEALRPFVFGDAVMEKILFGRLPDSASGTITVKNGDFRRARAVLNPSKDVEASDGR